MRLKPLPIDPENRLKIEGVPSNVRKAILDAAMEPGRIQQAFGEWLHTNDTERQSCLLGEIVDILYPPRVHMTEEVREKR